MKGGPGPPTPDGWTRNATKATAEMYRHQWMQEPPVSVFTCAIKLQRHRGWPCWASLLLKGWETQKSPKSAQSWVNVTVGSREETITQPESHMSPHHARSPISHQSHISVAAATAAPRSPSSSSVPFPPPWAGLGLTFPVCGFAQWLCPAGCENTEAGEAFAVWVWCCDPRERTGSPTVTAQLTACCCGISKQGPSPRVYIAAGLELTEKSGAPWFEKQIGKRSRGSLILCVNIILNPAPLRIRNIGLPALETLFSCSI